MSFWKIVLVVFALPISAWGDEMKRAHVECEPSESITKAAFDFAQPEKPDAVLVLLPGVNGDGGKFLEERAWTRFAASHNWAVVGATFVSSVDKLKWNGGYYDVAGASGPMLQNALARQGLKGKPLYLYGFSGGARFAARFTDAYPESVAAFATLGLGDIPEPTASKGPRGVIACGSDDERLGASLSWFKDARALGWRLSWVEAQGLGHVRSATVEEFIRKWFDEASRPTVRGTGGVAYEIGSGMAAAPESPRSATAWFPTSGIAALWKRNFFVKRLAPTKRPKGMQDQPVRSSAPRAKEVFSREIRTKSSVCPKLTLYGTLPDGGAAKGVICLSLIANDVGDIEVLLKGENREGVVGEWLRYAERRNLAVIAWAAPSGLWNSRSNWNEMDRNDNRSLSLSFRSVAVGWRIAVEEIARKHGLPNNRYLMIGFSRAAQFAMRLALDLPSKFSAVAIHVPSSFDSPVPEGRGIVWCLTTGENESGYARSLDFVKAAKKGGYSMIYKAYPGLGHADSMPACKLGQTVFDYVIGCTANAASDSRSWPYVADYVNQRVASRSEQSGIPPEFAVYLPSAEVAEAWQKE